jgi:hypothetical protein
MANLALLLHIILLVLSIVLVCMQIVHLRRKKSDIPLRTSPVGPGAPEEDAHILGYYAPAAGVRAREIRA